MTVSPKNDEGKVPDQGILYVVATPIGNLSDITLRALKTLESVDLILAEDTRHTAKLLSHFEIKNTLVSYRDQNHDRILPDLMEKLRAGLNIALVSDAGTPTISDPGFKLVRDIADYGIKVLSIPGASAVISALSVSGLPTDRFIFLGFLPKSSSKREELLDRYLSEDATVIIYESPYRMHKLLAHLSLAFSDRHVCVVKDITKMHEKIYRGSSIEIVKMLPKPELMKGEYTVLIAKEFD